MSLHNTVLETGKLSGTIFDFDNVGDKLPMHTHGPDDVHISIVARGSFMVHGTSFTPIVAKLGRVLDWTAGTAHEFEALEAGSRLINIIKGVKSV